MEAIVLGEVRGLYRRGPAQLKDPARWTKRDSDVLAHFLQVCGQIQGSPWYVAPKGLTVQGGDTLEAPTPLFEEFVFAAVYFRQLFMKEKDYLLEDAAKRYCGHVGCVIRKHWIEHEVESFNGLLDSPTPPFVIGNCTLRQLFDGFMYGAGLMHKIPEDGNAALKRFLDICDNYPRGHVLYALNGQLMDLMNHMGHIATIIHQDYAHWQSQHGLPLPDVRWHQSLFDVPTKKRPTT